MAGPLSHAFGPATPSSLRAAISTAASTPSLSDTSGLSARPLRPLRDGLVEGL